MNENINEFINQCIMILVFIIALSLFFIIHHNTLMLGQSIEQAYDSDNVFYEGNINCKSNEESGAEIIISIMKGLEYDITIDGRLILKDTDYKAFDFTGIDPSANYSVKNIVEASGKISKVIYLKK